MGRPYRTQLVGAGPEICFRDRPAPRCAPVYIIGQSVSGQNAVGGDQGGTAFNGGIHRDRVAILCRRIPASLCVLIPAVDPDPLAVGQIGLVHTRRLRKGDGGLVTILRSPRAHICALHGRRVVA